MVNEPNVGSTVGDAVQYLLSLGKDQLIDKSIDGVSKLEIFYIFLNEYKLFK